ncbi:RidA family protein [Nordella sp. HKS 07]|uniref:RidA family protein n=1 Tax=Nordella sp. HKS 07 TaxID=2712222 RepID=UPI0013E1F4A0|nr:RidA family protein [Nordella sp. HKS 07]QIG49794.1 RidA family protein [Nordella sp. HKS 07]
MKRQTFTLDNAEGLPLSDAVRFGDIIFVSGMVAFDDKGKIVKGGIAAETRQTFRNIERVLEKAGASLADVLKVNIILTHAEDFDAFNVAYRALFPKSPPARISMVAGLTIEARLEVDVIAGVSS